MVQSQSARLQVPYTPERGSSEGGWRSGLPLLPRRSLSAALLLAAGCGVAGLLALWWRQTPADRLQSLPDYLVMLAQITGLVGAYLLLIEIALMARFPWLERRLGSWLASAHRSLGGYLVLLLCAHVGLVVAAYSVSLRAAPPEVVVSILRTYPGVLAATAGFLAMLLAGFTSARSIRRRLGYEGWHAIHLLMYPAAAAAFWHQLSLGAQFTRNPWAAEAWAGLHTVVAAAVISNRIVIPFLSNRRHRFRVARVEMVGADVVSVYITGRHVAELGAEAGQYFRWRFLSRGLWYQAHPFSLSAAPQQNTLRLTFKCVGGYTKRLKRRLRPGARVLLDGPYGAFTGVLRRRRGVVMIGGGIGTTPLRAIAETLPGRRRDIVFIQRASKTADLVLTRELEALDRAGRIIYIPAVGSRKNDPLSADRLLDLVPDLGDRDIFICGSAGMTAATVRNLRRAKVRRGRIHTEIFDF
ncbi:MAG: ferric reductase [Catenulispora sp.]|nr:ferric reductase [Catenulispora sp.]